MAKKTASGYLPLETLGDNGAVPYSRLTDPDCVHQVVERLMEANNLRSATDAQVYGLISGKAPYDQSELLRQAQGWRSNFPSRIGEAAFNQAMSQYNDLILESPSLAVVTTEYGEEEEKQFEYGEIITEEFQRLNTKDPTLIYNLFLSQHDMVLFRCGPIAFEDTLDFHITSFPQRSCLVPDESKSTVEEWPLAVLMCHYTADKLYGFIRNPEAATAAGANVPAIRKAIMNQVPQGMWGRAKRGDWEWLAQRLRNNDIYYGTMLEAIPVAHVYYREFAKAGEVAGKISRASVLVGNPKSEFLWRKIGQYDRWQQVINPMYYDRGDGTHHSVKGFGIKGWGAWSNYDRLQCHLVDAAFIGSSMHFQAASPNDLENLSVVAMGPYMWHPPGGTYLQTQNIGASLEAPMAVKQDLLSTVTTNLAQYRADLRAGRDRVTGKEVESDAAKEAAIGKSQIIRYFEQLDDVLAERLRRAANPKLLDTDKGGPEAREFQKRCMDRGVPAAALQKCEVKAWHSIGYGSADARQQSLNRMLERLPLYDETGRERIIDDVTASDVGYKNMRRYRPKGKAPTELDQQADATDKVAGMKVGVAPIISPSQNPVIYAEVWLKAADEAAGTVARTNGQTVRQVVDFLEVSMPKIHAQLERFKDDTTRKQQYENFTKHWQSLADLQDKLVKQLQAQMKQQAQQQQQLQQMAQKVNGELAIKARESQSKVQLSAWKAQRQMQIREQVHRSRLKETDETHKQNLAIKDATTATDITLKKRAAFSE